MFCHHFGKSNQQPLFHLIHHANVIVDQILNLKNISSQVSIDIKLVNLGLAIEINLILNQKPTS
jgi:hypothetical protein